MAHVVAEVVELPELLGAVLAILGVVQTAHHSQVDPEEVEYL
jgi:hypothetical protein